MFLFSEFDEFDFFYKFFFKEDKIKIDKNVQLERVCRDLSDTDLGRFGISSSYDEELYLF